MNHSPFHKVARTVLFACSYIKAVDHILSFRLTFSSFPHLLTFISISHPSTAWLSHLIPTMATSSSIFPVLGPQAQKFRQEADTFGDLQVPADRYWGAQTQR